MTDLKPCPCGVTPKNLSITDAGQGMKWAHVCGDCCGEWETEFRTSYNAFDSPECMEIAIQAWNETPRERTVTEKYHDEIVHSAQVEIVKRNKHIADLEVQIKTIRNDTLERAAEIVMTTETTPFVEPRESMAKAIRKELDK